MQKCTNVKKIRSLRLFLTHREGPTNKNNHKLPFSRSVSYKTTRTRNQNEERDDFNAFYQLNDLQFKELLCFVFWPERNESK